MKITYKYRLYPTKSQEIILNQWLNTCRILYNKNLQQRKELYETEKKSISYNEQQNQLPKLKQSDKYLQEVHSQVLQDTLKRLDKAFQNFFRRIKHKENPGYPRFQGRYRYDSFTYPGFNFQLLNNKIKLPKIGYLKIKLHRLPKGKIKIATIKKNIDQWYIMLVSEREPKPKIKTIKSKVGIDLGLTHLVVLSDGIIIDNPRYFKKSEMKLRKQQQILSRRNKGSKNRTKQKVILNKGHRKVKNQRIDFLHKLSNDLVNEFDLLVFEDLNIKNMLQSKNTPKYMRKGLNKSINNISWNLLTQFCNYKAEYAGKYIEFVDCRNTTRTCSRCNNIMNMSLEDRTYNCPVCEIEIDRDLNASRNILKRSKIGQDLPEFTPVEMNNSSFMKQEAH